MEAFIRPSPDASTPGGDDFDLVTAGGAVIAKGHLVVQYDPNLRTTTPQFVVARHISTSPMTDADRFLEGHKA